MYIHTHIIYVHRCPSLDQMHTVFNPFGDVIYGVLRYFEEEQRGTRTQVRKYKHLFRTVDAVTYADITTVELKDNVADLFVDAYNEHIAVMETSRDSFGLNGTTCRLYSVGRTRASASDDEEEGEHDEDDGEEDGGDGDDGSRAGGGGDMLDLHDHILSGNPQGLQMLTDLLGEGSEFDEDDLPSDLGEDDDEGSDDDDEAWAMESDHDGDDEHEGG